jgi:hypothetical protein
MASEKRDRQRANRELKAAEKAKSNKKTHRINTIKRYGMYTLIFAAALVALKVFFG